MSVEVASASDVRSVHEVLESLNRIGAPQIDAIKGNGVPIQGDWPSAFGPCLDERCNTDSGYASSDQILLDLELSQEHTVTRFMG